MGYLYELPIYSATVKICTPTEKYMIYHNLNISEISLKFNS